MANLGMGTEFYDYSKDEMNACVASNKIGNYALGHENKEGKFVPEYVGRSDSDLLERLKSHIDEGDKYNSFKFCYKKTVKEAFEQECKNYHDFIDQLDNDIHPRRPVGKNYPCPVCGSFDN